MKTKIKFIAVCLTAGLISLNSCKKDEVEAPKPQITLTELGLNNSKIGYIGSDLHIEADIIAEGIISTVKVEIHPEGSAAWEFEMTYNEFAGLKNATFHKHIEIPLTAEAGDYHFHFIVNDKNGNQAVVEMEFEIKQPADTVAPLMTITAAPANGQAFNNGETISITGSISDNISLGGIYIGLVRLDQNLTDPQVNADNTITLLHTHNFPNPTLYNFSGSIIAGAALDNDITPDPISWTPGNYYILVKCKDAFGGNWTFSNHYPIVIN